MDHDLRKRGQEASPTKAPTLGGGEMAAEWAAFPDRWSPVAGRYLAHDARLRGRPEELRVLTSDVVAEAFAVLCETGRAATARKVVTDVARLAAAEVKRRWRHEVPLNEVNDVPGRTAASEDDSARRDGIWAWLEPLLDRLPEAQRAAIEGGLDNVPDAEIAREIGYGEESIKELRRRAMRELKRLAALVPPPGVEATETRADAFNAGGRAERDSAAATFCGRLATNRRPGGGGLEALSRPERRSTETSTSVRVMRAAVDVLQPGLFTTCAK